MSKSKPWPISGSWIPHRLEVRQSPSWRNAPRALVDLLGELEIELMRHKGATNGQIFRSYTQLIEAGFSRNTVSAMTRIGEALGLLRVDRATGVGRPDLKDASAYMLTYLPSGIARNLAPSDEWKRIKSDEQAQAVISAARKKTKKQNKSQMREAA